jgi:tetratricopeptide (TPR) repeat protein
MAEIDSKLNDQEAAIRHFEKAVLLEPLDAEVRYKLAQLYQIQNKDLDAIT